MRRRSGDVRFEIVDPAATRREAPRRCFPLAKVPSLVPVRVVGSIAPLARRSEADDASLIEVLLADGTQLRLPTSVGVSFIVEVLSALRAATC